MKRKYNQIKNKKNFLYLFCLVSALLPLLVCSKSSPLYPFNDWPDINIFYTMGRGMLHGQVPYVDLTDQKGPYIFALAGLACVLTPGSFLGYFLVEVLSLTAFLAYSYKIIRLYTPKPAVWALPLLSAAIVSAKSFVHGGSLEELCLGIFAYGVYTLLDFLRDEEKKPMRGSAVLINGIWAGVLLWSKFTLLGLYIGWFLTAAAIYVIRRQGRELLRFLLLLGAGALGATLPWIIYFGFNHALTPWLKTYVWDNIFGYSAPVQQTLWEKISTAVMNALRSLKEPGNRSYSLPVIAGVMAFICFPARKAASGRKASFSGYRSGVKASPAIYAGRAEKAAVVFLGAGMALGIFIGGTKHDYYGLPLSVFSVFGALALVIAVGAAAERLLPRKVWERLPVLLWLAAVSGGTLCAFLLSENTYLLGVKREEMPQFRFAEQILASEDTSLLNYGFLDGGFYTACRQVPSVKEYCVLNLNPDVMLAEQNRYLEQKRTNWVVTWKAFPMPEEELRSIPVLSEHYELTDYLYFFFEGDMRTYALYRRTP